MFSHIKKSIQTVFNTKNTIKTSNPIKSDCSIENFKMQAVRKLPAEEIMVSENLFDLDLFLLGSGVSEVSNIDIHLIDWIHKNSYQKVSSSVSREQRIVFSDPILEGLGSIFDRNYLFENTVLLSIRRRTQL